MDLLSLLAMAYLQRAIIAGTLIAIACAICGVFLVSRRFALIGDGLAHAGFASIALALLLGLAPLLVAVPLIVLAALGMVELGRRAGVHGDAAIGMVASLGIATGVLLAHAAGGFTVDLFAYLFGSILAVGWVEVWLAGVLALIVSGLALRRHRRWFALVFDEEHAAAQGIDPVSEQRLLVVLSAVVVVLGIRMVGSLLVTSLLIFPAVSASQIAGGFRSMIPLAAACAVLSVWLGLAAALVMDAPPGACIVMASGLCFVLAAAARRLGRTPA